MLLQGNRPLSIRIIKTAFIMSINASQFIALMISDSTVVSVKDSIVHFNKIRFLDPVISVIHCERVNTIVGYRSHIVIIDFRFWNDHHVDAFILVAIRYRKRNKTPEDGSVDDVLRILEGIAPLLSEAKDKLNKI